MNKPKLRNIVLDIYLLADLDTSEMTIVDIVALGLDEQDGRVRVDTIDDLNDVNLLDVPLHVLSYFYDEDELGQFYDEES